MPGYYKRRHQAASYANIYYRKSRAQRRRIGVTKTLTRRRQYYRKGGQNVQELKFFDSTNTNATIGTTGAITGSINLVPQGIAENQRIGRKIQIRSIACRWWYNLPVQQDQADIPSGDTLRIIVFLDRQANGANAAVTDILETAQIESYINLANKNRFQIIMDRKYTLNRQVAVTDGTNQSTTPLFQFNDQWYKKLNIPVEFNSTAGAITEVRSNNFAMLYISQNGKVGVGTQRTRIRYDG